jgi:hypothetical protein
MGRNISDEKRGIAYFPLGSPTYDYDGADRVGMVYMETVFLHWMPARENISAFPNGAS